MLTLSFSHELVCCLRSAAVVRTMKMALTGTDLSNIGALICTFRNHYRSVVIKHAMPLRDHEFGSVSWTT